MKKKLPGISRLLPCSVTLLTVAAKGKQDGEFVLNVASSNQVKLARQLGFTHGKEMNKFKRFNVTRERPKKLKSPLIKGSYASMECKVITALSAANYVVYLAEVVAYKVDEKKVPVAWHRNKYFPMIEETR